MFHLPRIVQKPHPLRAAKDGPPNVNGLSQKRCYEFKGAPPARITFIRKTGRGAVIHTMRWEKKGWCGLMMLLRARRAKAGEQMRKRKVKSPTLCPEVSGQRMGHPTSTA